PLQVPNEKEVSGQNPCVQLLVEHTQAINPAFALTEGNAEDIAAICIGLEGVPLAIQLAASAVSLSPKLARDALNHRLKLLSQGSGERDLPPRHRTLRQAIEWSYDLLNAEEQSLFRRLGVFAGSFPPDAAQAVAYGLKIEDLKIEDLKIEDNFQSSNLQ